VGAVAGKLQNKAAGSKAAGAYFMIEPIMFIGIGFLVAGLLVIGAIPMVHARAVRLTQRRLEAMTPMSMAEIHADKDQLRAEFAMSTRRLEMSVDQMKAKTSSQLAEIGKKSEAVGRLKLELGEKAAALLGAEAKVNALTEELQSTRNELAAKTTALQETESALANSTAELARLTGQLSDSSMRADSQRVELVTLQAQAEVLKNQIESYEQEIRSLQGRLDAQTVNVETAGRQLAEERIRTETHGARVKEFEKQLIVQTTEAEILGRRVTELLARLDEHERLAVEREASSEQYRNQLAAAAKTEAGIRAELAEREDHQRATSATLTAEKAIAEEQLKLAHQERDQLRRDIAALKQEAESAWATERMETAVMRERINDVAAEVARLTSVLEGPSSPIEAILAGEAGPSHAAANGTASEKGNGEKLLGAIAANGGSQKGSLADRIRALQNRRARVAQPS
jgi:peptidoglycan hydrolase CwlO-like protein